MKRYKSEIKESIHSAAKGLYKAGAINDEEMRHFDEACLAKSAAPVSRVPTQKPAVAARSGVPLYAQGK
jgi:DNA-binding transcriptional regulator YiaG